MHRLPSLALSTKTAALAVSALLVQSIPSAFAFSAPSGYQNGAPFSNGTFFSTEGTFQATIRGTNLMGVAVFSTWSDNTFSDAPATGIFSVAREGFTYKGNVNAVIDNASGNIAATLEASIDRQGTGQLVSVYATEDLDADSFIEYTATTDYNDVLYASGSFDADLYPTYPQQAFKGDGDITFQEVNLTESPTNSEARVIPTLSITKVDVKVEGVRTSDTATVFLPETVDIPYVFTTFQYEIVDF